MEIVKSLDDSGLLIKDISKIIKNETNEKKVEFHGILFCTLGASLLGNTLAAKGVLRADEGTIRDR